jgi:hypothetical protein
MEPRIQLEERTLTEIFELYRANIKGYLENINM